MPRVKQFHHGSTSGPKGPRFGLRVPADGAPVPYRVLVSTSWLWAGLAAMLAAGVAAVREPRKRVPQVFGGIIVAGCAAIGIAVGEASRLSLQRVSIPVPNLPSGLDGLTVLQLSDLHLGWPFTAGHLRRAMGWVAEVRPQVIVLTGDFIHQDHDMTLLRQGLAGIRAPYGVYAVLGNHDYWIDVAAIEQVFQAYGVVLLRNERRVLDVDGAQLCIVGIDCVWEALHDVAAALNDLPAGATTIVLAHEPDIADEVAEHPVTLQLSGHTHAGHFALPGLGPAFLPRHGTRYFRGLQRVGRMWLYVSRGLGGFPFRIGCLPEATALTLISRDEGRREISIAPRL